ncbi:hypothetical protein KGF56_001256 [Candida oxycetoniae]|uniref:Alpha-1,2-mannosyltransferase n=1 Tax=Candida oxycetoniae TaxID=497107 RepID=A0AAI9WZ60_9ASCO|nr:uncharacterized protein KGF56_001256 [Candida oxycetoniae]KAI3406037.2 hypothetical protein KGF56_001256 [Candida oxycetoniae]
MILKHRLRVLVLIAIGLIGVHLLTSNRFHSNDLQSFLDNTINAKPNTGKNRPPEPGKSSGSEKDKVSSTSNIKPVNPKIRNYKIFFDDLDKYSISEPSIKGKYITEKAKELFSTDDSFLFSKEYLENVLDIPDATYKAMADSHYQYVHDHIPNLINKGVATFGKLVPSDPEWSKYHGSSGYVLIGGGKYSWLSYLVIKQIRATGAKLPIELFLASKDDYEETFCTHIQSKYNARCNVFDTELAKQLQEKFNIGGYQYKMLALLSSQFENVFYIDSDNFPTKNIDYIFDSELYKKNNLILWPDAWARTTNPKFYEIAEVEVKENKLRYSKYDIKQAGGEENLQPFSKYTFADSWFHDFEGTLPDPTSETGMLVINKTSHLKTLLLCLYYNVFGPNFYYPILTQGSAGEGDKETFIAAATVMKEPWHQTLKQFQWVGYHSKATDSFTSKALGHFDPVQANDKPQPDNVDIVFMHLSYPKFYPNWLVDNNDLIYKDSDEHIRMYSAIDKNVGYDFDLRIFQFFTEGICPNYYKSDGSALDSNVDLNKETSYMGNYLEYIRADEETNRDRCEKVFIPHLEWLKKTIPNDKSN